MGCSEEVKHNPIPLGIKCLLLIIFLTPIIGGAICIWLKYRERKKHKLISGNPA